MGTAKFTISMPDELVEEIDDLAQKRGSTRSGVLREATAEYVARRKDDSSRAEREERWRRLEAAMEVIRHAPDAQSVTPVGETLHELRDGRELGILGEDPHG